MFNNFINKKLFSSLKISKIWNHQTIINEAKQLKMIKNNNKIIKSSKNVWNYKSVINEAKKLKKNN